MHSQPSVHQLITNLSLRHMLGTLIIAYVMEAFKKFARLLSRKNKQSAKQNSSSLLATDSNDNAGLGKHILMVPHKLLKQKYPETMTMAENDVLVQEDDMVDFKARCSGLSGLQGARHVRVMKASHTKLATSVELFP